MARRLLLAGAVVALLLAPALPASSAEVGTACSDTERRLGLCARVGDDEVILSLEESLREKRGPRPDAPPGVERPPNLQDPECLRPQPNRPQSCFEATAEEEEAPGIPTITVRDIATFVPTPGRQQMEPDGWAVAGLDTNFYAITGTHVVTGTLLGRSADVRFIPTSYRWAYGDGATATKATKGGTWAALGIPEFEPTPTSHVYDELGDYTITLSIVFAAEYRFAGGAWRPVIGTITLPANDLHIRVGSAKTVLVEHDCLANPAGPGC